MAGAPTRNSEADHQNFKELSRATAMDRRKEKSRERSRLFRFLMPVAGQSSSFVK
jgi:hypothetical protein